MDLIKQKINQTHSILNELDIDLWLVFVRETLMMADPVLPIVIGADSTWESFFLFSRDGRSLALVGNFDRELFTRDNRFTEVITYTEGASGAFRELIAGLNPRKIAVNYSANNPAADGLTHGMFLILKNYLKNTPYVRRFISAEEVCSKIRSRKLPAEIDLLSKAAHKACDAWDLARPQIATGMTEIDIAAIIDQCMIELGAENSFHTIVNAGDKSAPGHGQPSTAILEPGDLLHIDFGVRLDNYCSDLQRLVYFRKPNETSPPAHLIKAFDQVRMIIDEAAVMCRPGIAGWEVDAHAREILVEQGYPEYQHALGHQLGRDVHDGGALIGPKWERYGSSPMIPLEEGNVFTLELEIMLPGIGCVGLEEDVVIEKGGARFLCPRQEKLVIV